MKYLKAFGAVFALLLVVAGIWTVNQVGQQTEASTVSAKEVSSPQMSFPRLDMPTPATDTFTPPVYPPSSAGRSWRTGANVTIYPIVHPADESVLKGTFFVDGYACVQSNPGVALPICAPELQLAAAVWAANISQYERIIAQNVGSSPNDLAAGLSACIVQSSTSDKLQQVRRYYAFVVPRLGTAYLPSSVSSYDWADDRRLIARLFLCPDAFNGSFKSSRLTLPVGRGVSGEIPPSVGG